MFCSVKIQVNKKIKTFKIFSKSLFNIYIIISRLVEELRMEQEYAGDVEKAKVQLEQSCKEMQVRLGELEAGTVKGGKRLVQKLEKRVRYNIHIILSFKSHSL